MLLFPLLLYVFEIIYLVQWVTYQPFRNAGHTLLSLSPEPCQPDNVTAESLTSCNDTVVIAWTAASGAGTYSVTATGDLGYVNTFLTNETELWAELTCGQTFNFTVVAHDERCDSPPSYSPSVTNGTREIS